MADIRSLLIVLVIVMNIKGNEIVLALILVDYDNATRSTPHHKTIQGSMYPTQSLIL